MEGESELAVVFERRLWQGSVQPDAPAGGDESRLELNVIFTSIHATLLALQRASELARDLDGRIRLLVPQVVPYPLPLTSPPALEEFTERRFHDVAAGQTTETLVEICLCRDAETVLARKLKPCSLVVIGGRHTWRPTAEKAMAKKLRQAGHQVIFAFPERNRDA